jgi:hypothetical protein
MLHILAVVTSLTVLGPGVLAPADPLVLERTEVVRVWHGLGLDHFAGVGVVRLATENCDYLGQHGLVIVDNIGYPAYVVDCQKRDEEPRLSELGIVADVSPQSGLGHEEATILLWKH